MDRWLGRISLDYDSVGWLQALSAERLIGSQYTIPDDIILMLAGQGRMSKFPSFVPRLLNSQGKEAKDVTPTAH